MGQHGTLGQIDGDRPEFHDGLAKSASSRRLPFI
jgi:hypothetical protein